MDSNTFWIVFGTSKMFTKSGPFHPFSCRNVAKMQEIWKHVNILFLHIWTSMFCQFWRRRAPTNAEDPSNTISQIMQTGPIFIKTHGWNFANMEPISITKHKMSLGEFWNVGSLGIIFLGPKIIVFSQCFHKQNEFCDGGILEMSHTWKLKNKKYEIANS